MGPVIANEVPSIAQKQVPAAKRPSQTGPGLVGYGRSIEDLLKGIDPTLVGAFLGFIGAVVGGALVARMQERHRVRVHLLRDVLTRANQEMERRAANALVIEALMLRDDERGYVEKMHAAIVELDSTPPRAMKEPKDMTVEQLAVAETRDQLSGDFTNAKVALCLLLASRLRWWGDLSEIEWKLLGGGQRPSWFRRQLNKIRG